MTPIDKDTIQNLLRKSPRTKFGERVGGKGGKIDWVTQHAWEPLKTHTDDAVDPLSGGLV